LRAKGSSAPIILISGYDLEEVALRAKALRVFDIIQKPFSREALCNALKTSIESAPTVSPSIGGEVAPKVVEPVTAKKRLMKAIRIGAIILLIIFVAVTIYVLISGH
jgi:FixJ family two-component response regulator